MTPPYQAAIRSTYQKIREKLPRTYQERESNKLCTRIRSLYAYRYANRIGLYMAADGEIDLSPLWHSAVKHGKQCYYPALHDEKTLSFLVATHDTQFSPNAFGISEPEGALKHGIPLHDLDILFVPLVAFDANGTRLGRGAGYYDRTLATTRPRLLIGVAYEFQRYHHLEPNPWDVPLDIIITNERIYQRRT